MVPAADRDGDWGVVGKGAFVASLARRRGFVTNYSAWSRLALIANAERVTRPVLESVRPNHRRYRGANEGAALVGYAIQKGRPGNVEVYAGCVTVQDLAVRMLDQGYEPAKYAVVTFRGQYYGVAFESYTRRVVAGGEGVWYYWQQQWREAEWKGMRLPYRTERLRYWEVCPVIAQELRAMDPGVEVWAGANTVGWKDKPWRRFFLVQLGLTFHNEFYAEDEIASLGKYFRDDLWLKWYRRKLRRSGGVAINPFRGQILYRNGWVVPFNLETSLSGRSGR